MPRYWSPALMLPMVAATTVVTTPSNAASRAAHEAGASLTATLSGAGTKGAADGRGSFSGRLMPGKGQLCYTLSWSGIDAPTMAHIHTGTAGVDGPVYVNLPELGAGEHCVAIEPDKATAITANPQGYYVNVHNEPFPAGAIRGQLVKGGATGKK